MDYPRKAGAGCGEKKKAQIVARIASSSRQEHEQNTPIEAVAPALRIVFETSKCDLSRYRVRRHELTTHFLHHLPQRRRGDGRTCQHADHAPAIDGHDQRRMIILLNR